GLDGVREASAVFDLRCDARLASWPKRDGGAVRARLVQQGIQQRSRAHLRIARRVYRRNAIFVYLRPELERVQEPDRHGRYLQWRNVRCTARKARLGRA